MGGGVRWSMSGHEYVSLVIGREYKNLLIVEENKLQTKM